MSRSDHGALEYLCFRLSTHLDYRRAKAFNPQYHDKLMVWVANFVKDRPTSVLNANGDPESLLELGIRYAFQRPLRRTVQLTIG